MKFISSDLGKPMDASGNFFGTVAVSGLRGGVDTLGIAQRIGLSDTGIETVLPRCTFWVPAAANGTYGYLMVRGDYVTNGTAWFRVAAFQN